MAKKKTDERSERQEKKEPSRNSLDGWIGEVSDEVETSKKQEG